MTRVPATLSDAQAALAQAAPHAMPPGTEGYRYHALTSTYGGVEQRWLLIASEPRQPQARRTTVSTKAKHGSNGVAPPVPVQPMRSRRWRVLRTVYRPPPCPRVRCTLSPAIANGGVPDETHNPTRSSTTSTGLWRPRSLRVRVSSISTVVSSWPPMNSMIPNDHRKRGYTDTKARGRRNAGSDLCKPHSF